jgi:hypothetical protein
MFGQKCTEVSQAEDETMHSLNPWLINISLLRQFSRSISRQIEHMKRFVSGGQLESETGDCDVQGRITILARSCCNLICGV